jgi:mono/diheme cytochrome c family protein
VPRHIPFKDLEEKGANAMRMRRVVGPVVVIVLAGSVAWATDGATVYRDQCAPCHGETGKSDTPLGESLKLPPLADDVNVAAMSDADIAAKIKGAAKHPPTTKGLPDDDLNAVAAFVKRVASGK